MKLSKINIVNNSINELLKETLPPKLSFKLIRVKKDIEPYINSAAEAIDRFAKENQGKENLNQLIREEENKVLDEDVEYKFNESIYLDELPEVKGFIIEGIMPILRGDDLNE